MNWRGILKKTAVVDDADVDSVARTRMAAIAGRTTGQAVTVEVVETTYGRTPDSDLPDDSAAEAVDTAPDADLPQPELDSLGPVDVEAAAVDPAMTTDAEADDSADTREAVPTETALPTAESAIDIDQDVPAVALDKLPGFPWTARFIGLWAREVRFACPDDLRGAVVHWQRWTDTQLAGTPLVEEAAEEFKAMLAVWRECGAEVPGLASDDSVARQLAEEAAGDAALAALLPGVLRVRVTQAV